MSSADCRRKRGCPVADDLDQVDKLQREAKRIRNEIDALTFELGILPAYSRMRISGRLKKALGIVQDVVEELGKVATWGENPPSLWP